MNMPTVSRPSLDFGIYVDGGRAVSHGTDLYLAQLRGHWFTYPPFAAILFRPMSALPLAVARLIWELASIAALWRACATVAHLGGFRLHRTAMTGVVAGALMLEPVWHTLVLGQINLFLLALVLTDVSRLAGGKSAGIGIGIASAIKLTPVVFVAVLVVTGRWRAAALSSATCAACTATAFVVAPDASRLYWSHTFLDTSRVGLTYIGNQSPSAAIARLSGGDPSMGLVNVLLAAAIGCTGLTVAAAYARAEDWLAVAAVTGTTGLLVSPISWTHHWVWVIPVIGVLMRDRVAGLRAAGWTVALFALAPKWGTPHDGDADEWGVHGFTTLIANGYLLGALAFLSFMGWQACTRRGAHEAARTSRQRGEPVTVEP